MQFYQEFNNNSNDFQIKIDFIYKQINKIYINTFKRVQLKYKNNFNQNMLFDSIYNKNYNKQLTDVDYNDKDIQEDLNQFY